MAIQTPLTQEQLIAQSLGQAAVGGGAGGIPGQGGLPAPTGMPGAPAMNPQLIAQALQGQAPVVNPQMLASSADVFAGGGGFTEYLQRMRQWKTCMAMGGSNCGPQPQQGAPAPAPGPAPGPVGI